MDVWVFGFHYQKLLEKKSINIWIIINNYYNVKLKKDRINILKKNFKFEKLILQEKTNFGF